MSAAKGKSKEQARQAGYDTGYRDALTLERWRRERPAAEPRDRLVNAAELAEDTGVPASVWLALRGLAIGPRTLVVGREVCWTLGAVDDWRADVEGRNADEKRAVGKVLDVFGAIRHAWDGC